MHAMLSFRFIGLALLAAAFTGCTVAKDPNSSKVVIQLPTQAAVASATGKMAAFPSDKIICFGVSVTGEGISESRPNSCSPSVGKFDGFKAGGALSIEVPKGQGRIVRVFGYLADRASQEACPAWTTAMESPKYKRVYPIGTTTGVDTSKEETEVQITVDFPGLSQHVVAQSLAASDCTSGTSSLKTVLHNGGRLTDSDGAEMLANYENPTSVAVIFNRLVSALLGSSLQLTLGSGSTIDLPPFLHSATQKPDSTEWFGLAHDGAVVSLSSTGEIEIGASCPFETCAAPVWMQSVAAGVGNELFGIDHAGNLYRLRAAGPEFIKALGPTVSHASFDY
jgi:hypothetical protein